MDPQILQIAIGVAVIAVIGGLGLVLIKSPSAVAEERLDGLSGKRKAKADRASGMLLKPVTLEGAGGLAKYIPSPEALARLYEQADVAIAFKHFLMVAAGLAVLGAVLVFPLGLPPIVAPATGATLGMLPFAWLRRRKKKRIKAFTSQMPDALELVARALRAGHGLASGMNVVAEEMPPPVAHEFGRVFEEQNLGVPVEEALRGLSERIPSMDVRFFVTAVVIQRATGGDLAEVLDKIGRLIRERFQIMGQVQALTAEGRLSGILLMGLPPVLMAFMFVLNPEYLRPLFDTPIGVKMLAGAGVMQVIGAVAIKKIVTIKL